MAKKVPGNRDERNPRDEETTAHDPVFDRETAGPDAGTSRGGSFSTDTFDSLSEFDLDDEAPRLPDAIGPYRIEKVLGEGGMGLVCLAEQTEPVRRHVAIKLIRAGISSQEILARFRAEQQALAMMSHPGIATVLEAGTTDDGQPYFVMEYVPGTEITQFCDEERLDTEERVRLFIQLCDAVHHAHQRGIIHRDIKPSNALVVKLEGKSVPKMIDFGIAKAVAQQPSDKTLFTAEGVIIGTPEYMSPEQAEGNPDIDTRTDIYSLGVLLYEILVGVVPFDPEELRSGGFIGIQRMIIEREPAKPSVRLRGHDARTAARVALARRTDLKSLLRRIQGDLDWIILKCLEKDRARRYSSASELSADLVRHLNYEPVLAGPPGIAYRAKKLFRKHREAMAAAAVFTIVLAVLAGVLWHASTREFRKLRDDALREIGRENYTAASTHVHALAASHPHHPVVNELKDHLAQLKRDLDIRESQRLQQVADSHWMRCLDLRIARKEEEDRLEIARAKQKYATWQPPWDRAEEIDRRNRIAEIEEQFNESYEQAIRTFDEALELAPADSPQRRAVLLALEKVVWYRLQDARETGFVTVPESYFRKWLQSLGGKLSPYLSEKVYFTSDPPGAEVHCFRYENRGERLFPIPFDPRRGVENRREGLLGGAFLEVEHVRDGSGSPFRPGDRLVEVGGKEVRLRGELARVLSKLGADDTIDVDVLRDGKRIGLDWTPFPSQRYENQADPNDPREPGRVVEIYNQFDINFAGYPLDFSRSRPVGIAGWGEENALEVDLPRGSYLFVLRKDGYEDVRYPVAVPVPGKVSVRHHVKLLEPGDIPEGFVYIPAGAFPYGGDPGAYNGLQEGASLIGGFFLGRLEVTFREYLRFLNDPEVSSRIMKEPGGDYGKATPLADWDSPELERFVPPPVAGAPRLVRLVPVRVRIGRRGVRLVAWNGSRWEALVPLDWPLTGVPMLAHVEYVRWLNEQGGRWRYRIPGDLEWEKAARGADRRPFVWGHRHYWSFCRSLGASYRGRPSLFIDRVGIYPTDESVYGVRDLAGSLKEPTFEVNRDRLQTLRGGEWETRDLRDFRAATRNRRRPEDSHGFVGLRLAADLPDGD